MLEFEDIFGSGEFDDDDSSYNTEFLGVEAGKTRNVLNFETLWEHANRRGYDVGAFPNGTSKDLEIENGNISIYVENFSDGRTALEIDFDDEVDDVEAYMKASVDQWLGEIIRREQKAYRAATNYVHNVLPEKAEEKDISPDLLVEKHLDFPKGDSLSRFHDEYRSGAPGEIGINYAAEFELWPFEKDEMNRSDLPGKMPIADEIKNPDLKSRNDLYQRIFLETVVEEAIQEYDLDTDMREEWLEYVDTAMS